MRSDGRAYAPPFRAQCTPTLPSREMRISLLLPSNQPPAHTQRGKNGRCARYALRHAERRGSPRRSFAAYAPPPTRFSSRSLVCPCFSLRLSPSFSRPVAVLNAAHPALAFVLLRGRTTAAWCEGGDETYGCGRGASRACSRPGFAFSFSFLSPFWCCVQACLCVLVLVPGRDVLSLPFRARSVDQTSLFLVPLRLPSPLSVSLFNLAFHVPLS